MKQFNFATCLSGSGSVLLSAVLIAGCAESGSSDSATGQEPAAATIEAPDSIRSWSLTSMTHQSKDVSLATTQPTLDFQKGEIRAWAGCNHISGPVTLRQDGRVTMNELGMTEMACDGPVMTIEMAYWGVLSKVTRFEVRDGKLILSDGSPDNQLVFQPAGTQIDPLPDEPAGDRNEADTVTIENPDDSANDDSVTAE